MTQNGFLSKDAAVDDAVDDDDEFLVFFDDDDDDNADEEDTVDLVFRLAFGIIALLLFQKGEVKIQHICY
jgi:hypothetical protein